MGLKTTNYKVEGLDLTLVNAYAIISKLEIDKAGNGKATFDIQQDRENAQNNNPFETVEVNFVADKTDGIYAQAYTEAKTQVFVGWEDDIVETEVTNG